MLEFKGRSVVEPDGSGEGLADKTVRGTTIARASCGLALIVAMTEAAASASIPARASLARFLLLFCGCCSSFALFDELLDLLAALLANLLVKARAVAVARCFAALLAALLTDLLVEGVAVSVLRSLAALAANLLVKLRAVLFLDGFAAFLPGFAYGHAAGFLERA